MDWIANRNGSTLVDRLDKNILYGLEFVIFCWTGQGHRADGGCVLIPKPNIWGKPGGNT
jgi:hypothetical protein